MRPKNILFISHNCEINGAVKVLLELVRFWKVKKEVSFDFLFGDPINDSLLKDFSDCGQIYRTRSITKIHPDSYDLIFNNTIANGWILRDLEPKNVPVVTYVHEMEFAIRSMKPSLIRGSLEYTKHFIACSDKVGENLQNLFKISKKRISVVHGFIDFKTPINNFATHKIEEEDNPFVIGILANMDYRKGIDRFLSILPFIPSTISCRKVSWIWCGQGAKFYSHFIAESCKDRVSMLGSRENPWEDLDHVNLLFSFSREDPFPLSFLEAIVRGIPIAGIHGAGGVDELHNLGYADTCKFEEDSIVDLLKRSLAKKVKVLDRPFPWFTKDQVPKIIKICDRFMRSSFLNSLFKVSYKFDLKSLGELDMGNNAQKKYYPSDDEFLKNDSRSNGLQLFEKKTSSKIFFSIILPLHNPNLEFFDMAVKSIINQIYENWELIIVDDFSNNKSLCKVLEAYIKLDSRIQVSFLNTHNHISSTLNHGVGMSRGDWVAFIDQDDEFHPNALQRIKNYLDSRPNTEIVYTDEDKIDSEGKRFDPYYKPDWNYRLLLSQNYFCHLLALKRRLFDCIQGFRKGFEGAQDWDLCLRATSKLEGKNIGHISEVLYHWRAVPGSTALDLEEKGNWVVKAQEKTLRSHFKSAASKVRIRKVYDHWEILPSRNFQIPKTCLIFYGREPNPKEFVYVKSLTKITNFHDVEILVPDLWSSNLPFRRYNQLESCCYLTNAEVVVFCSPFIEPMHSDWLEKLVFNCLFSDAGAVGPKLFHPGTNRIISAGMIRLQNKVFPLYESCPFDHLGDKCRAVLSQNMIFLHPGIIVVDKKKLPDQFALGESAETTLVELCNFMFKAGYGNIFLPSACCYLHEQNRTWFKQMNGFSFSNEMNIQKI